MFIPSVDGVSHCERELTKDEDMVQGVNALVGVLAEMLNGALDGVEYLDAGLARMSSRSTAADHADKLSRSR